TMGCILTEQEYMVLYPERLKDGKVFCSCGASNIRITCNSIHVCAVCNAPLYTTINDKILQKRGI
ncbi:MAG: hypothetical protein OEL57_15920, partial [Trichlorobacter sp.]|uniref:hypothetical protein n=1 Tax=Trichlorobacter sp. TaxID=2911007 RepID=UPI0025660941